MTLGPRLGPKSKDPIGPSLQAIGDLRSKSMSGGRDTDHKHEEPIKI